MILPHSYQHKPLLLTHKYILLPFPCQDLATAINMKPTIIQSYEQVRCTVGCGWAVYCVLCTEYCALCCIVCVVYYAPVLRCCSIPIGTNTCFSLRLRLPLLLLLPRLLLLPLLPSLPPLLPPPLPLLRPQTWGPRTRPTLRV